MTGVFFFTLNYGGYRYGWKRSDLFLYPDIPATLAITLESMESFLSGNPTFTPILLTVDDWGLSLIEKRLHIRKDSKLEINRRLNLAREELAGISTYINLIKKKCGQTFFIKDDKTIFDEIIPKIRELLKPNKLSQKL